MYDRYLYNLSFTGHIGKDFSGRYGKTRGELQDPEEADHQRLKIRLFKKNGAYHVFQHNRNKRYHKTPGPYPEIHIFPKRKCHRGYNEWDS